MIIDLSLEAIQGTTPSTGDKDKNITISNEDYDADLEFNRDDYFNQDISYGDKDNSGSLKENKYRQICF